MILKKAQAREHILAGFIIAFNNIDEVIALIKKSKSAEEAITKLNKRFLLNRRTGQSNFRNAFATFDRLEQEKIYAEMEELKKTIAYLKSIIENEAILKQEIVKELEEIKEEYADARRTQIEGAIDILTEADLIPDEEVVVTLP